jgi:sigma-B regulation protein RsbU (phosphoserine phosphatase)
MVHEIMVQQGCIEQDCKDAIMAVNEACMNIIQHAYCGKTDGKIIIEIHKDEGYLVFRLIDFASPVDKSKCKSRDLDDIRPGGLGIHLIQSVMDDMQYQEPTASTGNILELRKTIAR